MKILNIVTFHITLLQIRFLNYYGNNENFLIMVTETFRINKVLEAKVRF